MRQTATLRSLVTAALATAAALAAAAPATADPVTLVPNVAGQPTRLEVDADPRTGAPVSETPRSVTIAIARGLRIDTSARRRRCSDQQARNFSCPESSRIGRGHVEVTVSGYLPGKSFDAIGAIDAYLAPASEPGDIAGVVAQVTELVSGAKSFVRGRIVPVRSGRFGVELRFSELPGMRLGGPLASEVKRLRLFVWASRSTKIRTRSGHTQRVRLNLLHNPRRCVRTWPYQIRVGFPSGEQTLNGRVPCKSK